MRFNPESPDIPDIPLEAHDSCTNLGMACEVAAQSKWTYRR